MTNEEIKSILKEKKVKHLYHANTIATACTFLGNGGLCCEDMSRTTICSRHHRCLMNMISMWMYFMISSSTRLMVHKRETIAINMAR